MTSFGARRGTLELRQKRLICMGHMLAQQDLGSGEGLTVPVYLCQPVSRLVAQTQRHMGLG